MTAGIPQQQQDVPLTREEAERDAFIQRQAAIDDLLTRTEKICRALESMLDDPPEDLSELDLESASGLAWQIRQNVADALLWNQGMKRDWIYGGHLPQ